jgi:hypothetical protein
LGAFKIKYKSNKKFITYFENTYMKPSINLWHFGDSFSNIFLTNNISESLNNTIKSELTKRECQTIIEVFKIFKKYSEDLLKENLKMSKDIDIPNKTYIDEYELKKKGIILV